MHIVYMFIYTDYIHIGVKMLELKAVTKKWNTFCLNNISLELPTGYIMGLIGENGAGKTTLLSLMAGLYPADQGSIRLSGAEYSESEEAVKQEIGVVLHGDLFDGSTTLLRNARRYGQFYRRYDEALSREYMQQFHLDEKQKYRQLSKGEKLKFAMAFALSHKPKLLLLDEPTANFDRDFRKTFWDILKQYTAGGENSVILSTHVTSDIDRIADYLLYLQKGRQLLYGDIESIRDAYRMAAGEKYKIKLLKDRVVHMETGELGTKALVRNSGRPFDPSLKIWVPSIEELMYHMTKCTENS